MGGVKEPPHIHGVGSFLGERKSNPEFRLASSLQTSPLVDPIPVATVAPEEITA